MDVLNGKLGKAKWDVGGLFCFDRQIWYLFDVFKEKYGYDIPIKTVFGSYPLPWGNGRFQMPTPGISPEYIIEGYNNRGIGCVYTFSNTALDENSIDDIESNKFLDILGKQKYDGNGVAISCDVLSEHIRAKYPKLKQKASILKIEMEMPQERTIEYYNSLLNRFDIIYLHPDDNFKIGLLGEIINSNKHDRYELIVNEVCSRGCTVRHLHHKEVSKKVIEMYSKYYKPYQPYDDFLNAVLKDPSLYSSEFSSNPRDGITMCPIFNNPHMEKCRLSKHQLIELYDMGFRNFKIAGREFPWATMKNEILNFIFG